MICPLLQSGATAAPLEVVGSFADLTRLSECPRERCAWWMPAAEMCAVQAMALKAEADWLASRRVQP